MNVMQMKNSKGLAILMAGLLLLTGCQNPDGTQNNTGSGALIGGIIGAIAGSAFGGPRNGGFGTLIGAAAGAIGGGLIGHSIDEEQNARLQAMAPQTYIKVNQGQPLQVSDVLNLVKSGVSDDLIISQIQATHTVYHLTANDIIGLRNSGVSNKLLNFMINTPTTIGGGLADPANQMAVVPQAPPPAPVEVQPVAPGPGYVWIDGEWDWGGSTWVWDGGHWGCPPYANAVWIGGRDWHDYDGWHCERGHWR